MALATPGIRAQIGSDTFHASRPRLARLADADQMLSVAIMMIAVFGPLTEEERPAWQVRGK